ncbi:hypothetical protein C0993_005784 [Termitomyces sp. T159_Od127]|nr:hypothetical protein C0993_005784 [Termitomyces sp. T159_Od127]
MAAISPKWDARFAGPVPHDTSYYAKCMLGGALACGFTHAGITPLDVAKCNMQVNPAKYQGLVPSIKLLLKEEGSKGIWKGFGPTFVGYSAQGMFKYGLYEVFKDFYSTLAGEDAASKYKPAIWLAGSASAEVFADIALCPLEMTKVKIVTFASGYLAGVVCAIVSHPADSLVSLLGKAENKGKSFGQIANEVGVVSLATKGLGTRVIMIGTLTGFQWWIYDTFKSAMGLGTTGGK